MLHNRRGVMPAPFPCPPHSPPHVHASSHTTLLPPVASKAAQASRSHLRRHHVVGTFVIQQGTPSVTSAIPMTTWAEQQVATSFRGQAV